jgi:hypothetical protein
MDALTTFFAANAILCALALLGFQGTRVAALDGEARENAEHHTAGMAGIAVSVAFVSAIGALFI